MKMVTAKFNFASRFLLLLKSWIVSGRYVFLVSIVLLLLAAGAKAQQDDASSYKFYAQFPYLPPIKKNDPSAKLSFNLFNFPAGLHINQRLLYENLNRVYQAIFKYHEVFAKPLTNYQLDGLLMGVLVRSSSPATQGHLKALAEKGELILNPNLRRGFWDNLKLREFALKDQPFPIPSLVAQTEEELIRKYITPPPRFNIGEGLSDEELIQTLIDINNGKFDHDKIKLQLLNPANLTASELLDRYINQPYHIEDGRRAHFLYGQNEMALFAYAYQGLTFASRIKLSMLRLSEKLEYEISRNTNITPVKLYQLLDQGLQDVMATYLEKPVADLGQDFIQDPVLWRLRFDMMLTFLGQNASFEEFFPQVPGSSKEGWIVSNLDDPCPGNFLP